VIRGAKRLLEVRRTLLADRQQAIRQAGAQLAAYPVEPLANGHCDGSVMLSPVSAASSRAKRCVCSFLMFKPMPLPSIYR
jgi:hypothetical protein